MTDFTLFLALGIFIPSLLIFLGLKRFAPDITENVTVLVFSAYCVGFWLIFLIGLSLCFFVKKGSSIKITDQYIDFRWRRTKGINIDGEIPYSTISEIIIDDSVVLIVIGNQKVKIPLNIIMYYKGYNKVIDMLQQKSKA